MNTEPKWFYVPKLTNNNFGVTQMIFKFKMAQNSKNLRLNDHTSFEFQIVIRNASR